MQLTPKGHFLLGLKLAQHLTFTRHYFFKNIFDWYNALTTDAHVYNVT